MATLISNSEQLKANFGTLSLQFTWANISSFVEDVERDIIGDAIGHDALDYFAGNQDTLTGIPQQALVLLQRSISYLSIFEWSQTALYQFEDKALYVAKSTGGAVISDKKLQDLRAHCEEKGFKFLDKAIELMELNLQHFTAYAESGTRQSMVTGFIKTAAEFSRLKNINNSRLTFMSLHTAMIDVQNDNLPQVMTPAYYELFKERYLDDELTAAERSLLPIIKKAVAFLTIAEASKILPVKITSYGLLVNRYNNSMDYLMKDPASAAQQDYLQLDNKEKGDRELQKLKTEIIKIAGDLPGFVLPAADDTEENDRCSGIFSFPG